MEFSAQQIADFLKWTVEGDPDCKVNCFLKIEKGKPQSLTFLTNLKYSRYIYETQASIVLKDFFPKKSLPATLTLVRVPNAYIALVRLFALIERTKASKVLNFHRLSPLLLQFLKKYLHRCFYIWRKCAIG